MTDSINGDRGWWRIGLLTLFFAVLLVGLWFCYEVNWIRQRRDVLMQPRFSVQNEDVLTGAPLAARPPGLLWLFGEPGYAVLTYTIAPDEDWELTPAQEAEIERVAKLYPEAETVVILPNGPVLPNGIPRSSRAVRSAPEATNGSAFDGIKL